MILYYLYPVCCNVLCGRVRGMTNVSENKRTPGLVHLNIFHYDPAYDGSGLEPMGMSYIFPFTEDSWGAANELCNIFNSIAPGNTYDTMFSTITPTGTPEEALYECSAAVKYSSPIYCPHGERKSPPPFGTATLRS